MKLLKLAWRNVLRNRRRSLNTIIAISVGLASLIFVWGFIDGMNEQTIENNTTYLTGHLKIHQTGFHEDKALYLAMPQNSSLETLFNEMDHIVAVTPRIADKAMLSGDKDARGVKVIGIDPVQEAKVTTIAKAIIDGRFLTADDLNSILLGDNLAARAGLRVGDQAVLITQARDGSLAADKYNIVGLYNTGIDMIDATHVFIPLPAAQELYSLWGQITEWATRIDDRSLAEDIARQIKTKLQAENIDNTAMSESNPGYEVLTWKQLLPELVQMVRFHEVITYIVVLIVIIVVAVGVANTILMAVMERTREFGIMLALGTSQGQIIHVVLLESLLLGLIGLFFGSLLGLGITSYFGAVGIDLTAYTLAMETMPGLSGNVYPMIRWDHVMLVSVVTILTSIIPAFYPAWRVSRLQPVEAIRGVTNKLKAKPKSKPHTMPEVTTSHLKSAPFFAMAIRSVLRNPHRSILTAAATAFGLGAFLFLYAFTDGFFEQMIDNSIDFSTSHVQIEPKGFREQMAPALSISKPQTIMAQAKQHAAVEAVAPRIQAEAMISSPTKIEPLIITGIDPELEQNVTRIHSVIIDGQYLTKNSDMEIVLGAKLVELLDLQLGEKVVVTTQQADGNLGSAAYRLVGIYRTDNEIFDRSLGFIGLPQAQSLLALDNRVSTITLKLNKRALSSKTAEQLTEILSGTHYQAQSWEQIMPVVVQMIDVSRLMFLVVLIIVFFVVAIGVMNTLFMSVIERTREFGVMLAVGTEAHLIVRMIVYESIILGAIGIFAGVLIGIALVWYYSSGMDLSSYGGATGFIPGLTDMIYPTLIFSHLWLPTLLLFITGVLAALYPAIRAAKLEPVAAIRHV